MSIKDLRDRILAAFNDVDAGDPDPGDASATTAQAQPPPPSPGASPGTADAAAQFASAQKEQADLKVQQLEKKIAVMSAKARVTAASAFAKSMIDAKRAYPAEGEALSALYCQALADDEEHQTTVVFSADGEKKGSRADAIRALFAARTPHCLTEELLTTASEDEKSQFAVLFHQDRAKARGEVEEDPTKVSDARVAELLKMTTLGSAHFSEKAAPKNGGR